MRGWEANDLGQDQDVSAVAPIARPGADSKHTLNLPYKRSTVSSWRGTHRSRFGEDVIRARFTRKDIISLDRSCVICAALKVVNFADIVTSQGGGEMCDLMILSVDVRRTTPSSQGT